MPNSRDLKYFHSSILEASNEIDHYNKKIGSLKNRGNFEKLHNKMTSELPNTIKGELHNHIAGSFDYFMNCNMQKRFDTLQEYSHWLRNKTAPANERVEIANIKASRNLS